MCHVDHSAAITVLSLCAGYGGLEIGLARALANPLRVVAVEVEAYALANLEAKAAENRMAVEALWPDLRTFPAERFRGCFDFVLAGYPCQPFSVAGKRRGSDDPRHLWPSIRGIIAEIAPQFVYLENVAGHFSLGFDRVLADLEAMGFRFAVELFTALEAGVAIKGTRLFVLAATSGERLPLPELRETSSRTKRIEANEIESLLFSAIQEGSGAISKIPRITDGASHRVDRLRLLGNGVVPAQAELAFRTLYGRFQDASEMLKDGPQRTQRTQRKGRG
jgi:DNA (cytosine-5)-methyltransferase 1